MPLRTDTKDFFRLSGFYESRKMKWPHHPIIAIVSTQAAPAIIVISSVAELLKADLLPDTLCIQQWPGQWRSDFFMFTLQDARAAAFAISRD